MNKLTASVAGLAAVGILAGGYMAFSGDKASDKNGYTDTVKVSKKLGDKQTAITIGDCHAYRTGTKAAKYITWIFHLATHAIVAKVPTVTHIAIVETTQISKGNRLLITVAYKAEVCYRLIKDRNRSAKGIYTTIHRDDRQLYRIASIGPVGVERVLLV